LAPEIGVKALLMVPGHDVRGNGTLGLISRNCWLRPATSISQVTHSTQLRGTSRRPSVSMAYFRFVDAPPRLKNTGTAALKRPPNTRRVHAPAASWAFTLSSWCFNHNF